MTPEAEAINEAIEHEMQVWVTQFVAARLATLKKLQAEATGELDVSMEFEIESRKDAISLLIAFNDYGRMLEMDKRKWSHDKYGRNAIERVENWIKAKNLLQKWIPAFMKKYKRKTIPHDILNRMAWGVLANRTYGFNSKRKKWWNKPKEAALTALHANIAAALSKESLDQMKKQFYDKRSNPVAIARAQGRTSRSPN